MPRQDKLNDFIYNEKSKAVKEAITSLYSVILVQMKDNEKIIQKYPNGVDNRTGGNPIELDNALENNKTLEADYNQLVTLHRRFLEKGEEKFKVPNNILDGYKEEEQDNEYNQLMSLDSSDDLTTNAKKLEKIHKQTLEQLNLIKNINIEILKNRIINLHNTRLQALKRLNIPDQVAWNDLQKLLSTKDSKAIPFEKNQQLAEMKNDLSEKGAYRNYGIHISSSKGGGIQANGHDTKSTRAAVSTMILQGHTNLVISNGLAEQRNIAAKQAFREGAISRILLPDAEGKIWNNINDLKKDLNHPKKVFTARESENTLLLTHIYSLSKVNKAAEESRDIQFKMIFSAMDTNHIQQVLVEINGLDTQLQKELEVFTAQADLRLDAEDSKLKKLNELQNAEKEQKDALNDLIKNTESIINNEKTAKKNEIDTKIGELPSLKKAVLQGLFASIADKNPEERKTIFEKLEDEEKNSLFQDLYNQCNQLKAPKKLSWFSFTAKNNTADILFKEFIGYLPANYEVKGVQDKDKVNECIRNCKDINDKEKNSSNYNSVSMGA